MHDVFRAGVEPGGLTADYELRMLVCYILDRVSRPMPVSALIELFVEQGIGNYFEAANAAAGLVKNGHLEVVMPEEERCYALTELGKQAAETFEKDLPRSVREKAVQAAERYFVMKKRRAQNKTEIRQAEDGYLLTLTITDVGSDLLSLTILLPDRSSCEQLRDRFLEDPIVTYKGVVALLTGNYESMGALLDDGKA